GPHRVPPPPRRDDRSLLHGGDERRGPRPLRAAGPRAARPPAPLCAQVRETLPVPHGLPNRGALPRKPPERGGRGSRSRRRPPALGGALERRRRGQLRRADVAGLGGPPLPRNPAP